MELESPSSNYHNAFVIKMLCANPVDEELWTRIINNPQEVFIGLQDAGVIKEHRVELRRFERVTTKEHDKLEVWYFWFAE